ncbi:MAG: shikimate dehydrogenase [Candidatus Pacebacteria bacterium]|nr:shikimate dehydrogenase [Candidatus Paceibacterota bacterium]
MITTALLGSPVDHSVSPILFKLYADEYGLEYSHSKFDVKARDLETVIKSLDAYGFAGVNITLPYKADVIPFLDIVSEEAKAIGAVNTIRVIDGKLEGYNTDAFGALRAIEKASERKVGDVDKAIILGTGGAARAIVWILLQQEVSVTVVCREPDSHRTKTFKQDFSSQVTFITYDSLTPDLLSEYTIICNATSAGMHPNDNQSPIDLKVLENLNLSHTIVFDAIFNPVVTKFQETAETKGAILAYGIDMMIYQGIVAFEYWTGKKVSEETVQKATDILMQRK